MAVDTAPGVQPRAKRTEHGQVGVDARRFQRDEEQAAEVISHGAEGLRAAKKLAKRTPKPSGSAMVKSRRPYDRSAIGTTIHAPISCASRQYASTLGTITRMFAGGDREPDQPHGHLGGGRLPGSLAECWDGHQLAGLSLVARSKEVPLVAQTRATAKREATRLCEDSAACRC